MRCIAQLIFDNQLLQPSPHSSSTLPTQCGEDGRTLYLRTPGSILTYKSPPKKTPHTYRKFSMRRCLYLIFGRRLVTIAVVHARQLYPHGDAVWIGAKKRANPHGLLPSGALRRRKERVGLV
ncbi:hypothetical protein [Candidatus Magnetaquicoccus inordinatus]|uniref:hypothetical protein n=1 Tax=Candidatus Magnetaquicoccus inordinatus TaxID=2496818 RepID=UPI00102B6F91|nr:hypothetical protein [Candidatus Magnetaquicoccus inordinatus]